MAPIPLPQTHPFSTPSGGPLADESSGHASIAGQVVDLSIEDDLSAVESEWRAFEQFADCTVFQSFGWLYLWQRHIGVHRSVRPVIVIGRNTRGEIQFLLPLSVESSGFARRLMWLGSENSDYNAPLVAPDFWQRLGPGRSLWPEILTRIQGRRGLRFDLIHFVRMPAKVGLQPNPFCRLPSTPHPSRAYLTHLAGDWESFYASKRSTATRQRDRTKRKRLGEMGEIKLFTPQTADEISGSFDTLVAQKTRSFAVMGVNNIFSRPGYVEFYRSVALDPATRQIAHLSRLDVGEIRAAVNLGLMFRGCYYHLLASYADGEVSRYGPGAVHLHELMRYAIDTGCKVFDFTIGDEPYKRDWSDTASDLFEHAAVARWRGAFMAQQLLGMARVKHFIRQTPILWNTSSKVRAFFRTLRAGRQNR